MSNPNYTLEVVSHHPQFQNKTLRKYYVDGIETVGAWGDEEFSIVFKNNTWQKVQVKISLDGTDVFTGKPATTDSAEQMWVVQGYGTLSLKAFPETDHGGAAFVFTNANNSVAVHTHGDLSSRGIIAAAVFTEGHIEPLRVEPYLQYIPTVYPLTIDQYWQNGIIDFSICSNNMPMPGGSGDGTYSCSTVVPAVAGTTQTNSASLDSLVAVGAGQHVDQHISYVAGLIKPMLHEIVRVRYEWWDDLLAKLKQGTSPSPHASGFPGDSQKTHIDLKDTPRQGVVHRVATKETATSYQRV